ncbi:hypothetical protein [Amphibacillus sp. MSJ-3]
MIEEINVRFILAGEPANPNDTMSAIYPEDVFERIEVLNIE